MRRVATPPLKRLHQLVARRQCALVSTSRRLAIIGDIGGHHTALLAGLRSIGATDCPQGPRLPTDVTVVLVGDLVHRGPASADVVDTVDGLLSRQPDQIVVLAGNHEAVYLSNTDFARTPSVPARTAEILRRWWSDGLMRLAFAASTCGVTVRRGGGAREQAGAGDLLLTHAGLTAGLWNALGRPTHAHDAANRINDQRYVTTAAVWRAGRMLTGAAPRADAGVLWAEAVDELYRSWLDAELHEDALPSFHQAHGHSSAFAFAPPRWRPAAQRARRAYAGRLTMNADVERRLTRVEIDGRAFFGCDPSFDARAAPFEPLALELITPV